MTALALLSAPPAAAAYSSSLLLGGGRRTVGATADPTYQCAQMRRALATCVEHRRYGVGASVQVAPSATMVGTAPHPPCGHGRRLALGENYSRNPERRRDNFTQLTLEPARVLQL